MKKLLLVMFVLGMMAVVAIGMFVRFGLDSAIARAIEHQGTALTGTSVHVRSVEISLGSGEAVIRGLHVANPEGYSGADVLELAELRVRLDRNSLRKDPLVIEELRLVGAAVRYELDATGRSNVDALRDAMQERGGASTPSGGKPATASGDEQRITVRTLAVEGGRVAADTTAIGGKDMTLDLPTVRLDDIGGQRGAPASEIGAAIVGALTRAAGREVAAAGVKVLATDEIRGQAGGKVKGLLDAFGKR